METERNKKDEGVEGSDIGQTEKVESEDGDDKVKQEHEETLKLAATGGGGGGGVKGAEEEEEKKVETEERKDAEADVNGDDEACDSNKEREGGEREELSLDEITKYRESAQQKSFDAIRSAEERYQKKAKESEAEGTEEGQGEESKEGTDDGEDGVKSQPVSGEVGSRDYSEGSEPHKGHQRGGGLLMAIGETIVEIGQTTKELLFGKDLRSSVGTSSGCHSQPQGSAEESFEAGEGI